MTTESIAALVALLAVVVAFVALVRARRYNQQTLAIQQQNAEFIKLQRQNLEREEAERVRCQVAAYWYVGSNDSEHINVVNCGGIDAFNINFMFRPAEGHSSPAIPHVMDEIFPIARLRPEEDRNFPVAPAMGSARPWRITISWEDRDGGQYSLNMVLT